MIACNTQRLRSSEPRPGGSQRAATNAPSGNPTKSRSKKSDGMMKKLSSLKIESVNSAEANDRPKSPAASAAPDGPSRPEAGSVSPGGGYRSIGIAPPHAD